MPRFMPSMPFPPKSAMHVPPAFRARKIPNPSPPGGAPLGAPSRGLQYGNEPKTGKAWIPRVRGGRWARDSPQQWRQPRKRLTAALNSAEAVAAPAAAPQQGVPHQKHKPYKFDLGWGVSAPRPNEQRAPRPSNRGVRGRATGWQPNGTAAAAPPKFDPRPAAYQQNGGGHGGVPQAQQQYHGYQTRAALKAQAARRAGFGHAAMPPAGNVMNMAARFGGAAGGVPIRV